MDRTFQALRKLAEGREREPWKVHHHVALAIRADGVKVLSVNTTHPNERNWRTHAEARLCRKLTPRSVVYVVRIRKNGDFAASRPCEGCQRLMRRVGVTKVLYSIDEHSCGAMLLLN